MEAASVVVEGGTAVDIEENSCLVFTDSVERATAIVEEYERQTCSRFISASSSRDFGKLAVALNIDAKRVYWNKCYKNETEASTPYIIVGQKLLDCHHGKDPDKAKKAKYKAEKEKKENPVSYLRVTPSKKVDCPAKIILRDVVYFTDFKIPQDTKYHRQVKGQKLKADFKINECGKITRHILVTLPATNGHRNHLPGEEDCLSQRVDPRVSKKIDELLAEGINNINEIQRQLKSFVTIQRFPGESIPLPSNRRYFPSKKTIRAKIYQFANQQKRLSVIEQQSEKAETENDLREHPELGSISEEIEIVTECDLTGHLELVRARIANEVETDEALREHPERVDTQEDLRELSERVDTQQDLRESSAERVDLDTEKNISDNSELVRVSKELINAVANLSDNSELLRIRDNVDTEKDLKAQSELVRISKELETDNLKVASTVEEATAIVKGYERRTFSKFVSRISPKDFGKLDAEMNLEAKKIYWDESYAKATPYINISQKQLECEYGKIRDESKKVKRKVGSDEMNDDSVASVRGRPSKKVDCPAKIVIRDLVYFTDFKISDNTKHHRERISKRLKTAFKSKKVLRITRHFYINLPSVDEHRNHMLGQVTSPPRKRKRSRKRVSMDTLD